MFLLEYALHQPILQCVHQLRIFHLLHCILGNNILNCKPQKNAVLDAVNTQIKVGKFKTKNLYGKGNAGKKIASILEKHKPGSTQKIITY